MWLWPAAMLVQPLGDGVGVSFAGGAEGGSNMDGGGRGFDSDGRDEAPQ